jgi:hypothetical protein
MWLATQYKNLGTVPGLIISNLTGGGVGVGAAVDRFKGF